MQLCRVAALQGYSASHSAFATADSSAGKLGVGCSASNVGESFTGRPAHLGSRLRPSSFRHHQQRGSPRGPNLNRLLCRDIDAWALYGTALRNEQRHGGRAGGSVRSAGQLAYADAFAGRWNTDTDTSGNANANPEHLHRELRWGDRARRCLTAWPHLIQYPKTE